MAVRLGQEPAAPAVQPSIPSIYAAQLVQLARRWGIAPAQLLSRHGLDEAQLDAPEGRVSPLVLRGLILGAQELTNEPGLGFYYGLQLKLASHGTVGLAALAAATLGDAVRIAERFCALRAPYLRLSCVRSAERAELALLEAGPTEDLRVFVTEALFTALIQMGTMLLGRPLAGVVELAYPEPAHFPGFAHLWPGPARFSRPVSRMTFAASLLDEPLQMADAVAAKRALAECERELGALKETSSLLADVRRQLGGWERGFPSLTELARARHVSARTLKRRLAEQGTSYRQLLDELRRDRALSLLEVGGLTVEQIAEQLGYSDPANFNRAFRRWLGVAPSAFRAQSLSSGK